MEQAYAHALMRLIKKGITPRDAVAAIVSALRERGRDALLLRVGRAFERIFTRVLLRDTIRITVARAEDAGMARKAAGVSNASVRVDDSLIGGWRMEKADTLRDASYKKYLLEIYNRATHS